MVRFYFSADRSGNYSDKMLEFYRLRLVFVYAWSFMGDSIGHSIVLAEVGDASNSMGAFLKGKVVGHHCSPKGRTSSSKVQAERG